jgi:hypothetical protein
MNFNQIPVNLTLSAGASFSKSFVVRNDDYSPRNLERTVIKGSMAKHPGALNADLSTSDDPVYKVFPLDISVPNGTNGEYFIGMASENSKLIPEGKYVYNVVMTNIAGEVENLMSGLIFVDSAFASLP